MLRGLDRRLDVRTPANPQDFETTVSLKATPPMEFSVTAGSSSNNFSIMDGQTVPGRGGTAQYRIYFLPQVAAPTASKLQDAASRSAAKNMASLVTSVTAPGLGTTLTASDTTNFGSKGWYFCVAVNERGIESPMEHMVAAP